MIFITQEVYVFLAVNASLRWVNNVNGVYIVQVSLLLIGQQCLEHFFRYRPLLPIGGGLCKLYAKAGGKWQIQCQLLFVPYKQQANPLLLIHNDTPLVISGDKKCS